jgi:hypothetical protein
LVDYISKIDFQKFENSYDDNHIDGNAYKIFIKNKSITKLIFVHSNYVPVEIKSLLNKMQNLKQRLKLQKTSKQVKFESIKGLLPPPLPPKSQQIKFVK